MKAPRKPVTKSAVPGRLNSRPQEITRSGDLNEQQVIKVMQKHINNPFAVLNRNERKLVQEHMAAELAQGFEHRRIALDMALETRLQSIKEACNHVLVTGKTELRQQRIDYFGKVFRKVEKSMSELSDSFLLDMDARFDKLEQYNNPIIKQREQARLEKGVGDFLDTLDQLMLEFRSIIHENITHGEEQPETEVVAPPADHDADDMECEEEYAEMYPEDLAEAADRFMNPHIADSDWIK